MYIATKGWTIIATAESYSDLISQLANSRGDKIEAIEARHDYGLVSGLAWEMHVNGDHEAITIHDDGERITWTFRGRAQPQQWPSRQKHPDGVSLGLATETALRLVVRHYQQQGLCYVYQVKELSL